MTHLVPLVILLAVPWLAPARSEPAPRKPVEVQVLAILVSEHHAEVHPKLKEFARLVQTKEPGLTGFRLERTTTKSLEPGDSATFALVGTEVVEVTVNKERNEQGRITLTIVPPGLNHITYECECGKFFSMATRHFVGKDRDRQQLFIAIMATPCKSKK